jgi:hypothetical protein
MEVFARICQRKCGTLALPEVAWTEIDAQILERRRQQQLELMSNGAHKFHEFCVGDVVLASKQSWNNEVADNAQLYEMLPKWVGPWKVVKVFDERYYSERVYVWKNKARGRDLAATVSMNIRYVKHIGRRIGQSYSVLDGNFMTCCLGGETIFFCFGNCLSMVDS